MYEKHKLTGSKIPSCLQAIHSTPKQLFVLGKNFDELLSQPCVAIVGSRKVTPYGRTVTHQIASELSARGVVIVSGLALGVDSIAHAATVESGGKTIAVLPCGLDNIYPRSHTQLAKQIIEQGGALVSEYPEGTEPFPANFVARNRLIAGLGQVLVITEAAVKSGSLHTANFALEEGKPIGAVPGNITSMQSEGANNLIKTGATPITGAQDVLDMLGLKANKDTTETLANNEEEQIILTLIKAGNSDGAQLLSLSELDPALFSQTLSMLEITGRIKPLGGNHWSL